MILMIKKRDIVLYRGNEFKVENIIQKKYNHDKFIINFLKLKNNNFNLIVNENYVKKVR